MICLLKVSISWLVCVTVVERESCILISDFSRMRVAFDVRSSLFSWSLTVRFSMSSPMRSESWLIWVVYAMRSASCRDGLASIWRLRDSSRIRRKSEISRCRCISRRSTISFHFKESDSWLRASTNCYCNACSWPSSCDDRNASTRFSSSRERRSTSLRIYVSFIYDSNSLRRVAMVGIINIKWNIMVKIFNYGLKKSIDVLSCIIIIIIIIGVCELFHRRRGVVLNESRNYFQ